MDHMTTLSTIKNQKISTNQFLVTSSTTVKWEMNLTDTRMNRWTPYNNGIWKFLVSIIEFDSHLGNFVRKYFLAGGPLSVSPNAFRNFTQTKAKKKCTSNKSKSIWTSHGKSQKTSSPASRSMNQLKIFKIKRYCIT